MSGCGSYRILEVSLALLMAGCFVLLLPGAGLAYPTDENFLEDAEPLFYPMPEMSNLQDMDAPHKTYVQKPKNCFHFFVSRNMSSLLSDATKMLQQVRDRHEREWILTFIYRIKSLAEHLRTHPDSRNYKCLPGENEDRQRADHMRIPPQPELYFEDDLITSQKRNSESKDSKQDEDHSEDQQEVASDNQVPSSTSNTVPEKIETNQDSTTSSSSSEKDSVSPPPSHSSAGDGILLSSPPDCEANRECERALNRQIAEGILSKDGTTVSKDDDDQLIQQVHGTTQEQINMEEDRQQQKVLKKRIRKALLEEMAPEVRKLRTVGGSEEDLINLWKQSEFEISNPSQKPHYNDFDYEEIGAAAGDLTSDRFTTNDHTVAPSVGDMKNLKRQSNSEGRTKPYEPYDDSDVLVKQLFDVRYEQAPQKPTTSVNSGRKDEYLITSTSVPY